MIEDEKKHKHKWDEISIGAVAWCKNCGTIRIRKICNIYPSVTYTFEYREPAIKNSDKNNP
jgi:hypothetical protein